MGGQLGLADAGEDRAGDREGRQQRAGAHDDVRRPSARAAAGARAVGAARLRRGAQQLDRERRAHARLRDDGAQRAAVEPGVEAVDEHHLRARVDDVARDDEDERRAQVVDRRAASPMPASATSAKGSPRALRRR